MNDIQKKKLERNLSQSASGAKIFWVRALIGTSPEQQGFIDPILLPIDKNINLGDFYNTFKEYLIKNNEKIHLLEQKNKELSDKNKELKDEYNKLSNRILSLESFKIE